MPELAKNKSPLEMPAVIPDLKDLTEIEVGILYAMLTTGSDADAMLVAPVKRETYYKYKPKLIRYVGSFKLSQREKLGATLEIAAVKAVLKLSTLLEATSEPRDALPLAKEILDRTIAVAAPTPTDDTTKGNQQMIVQILTKRSDE